MSDGTLLHLHENGHASAHMEPNEKAKQHVYDALSPQHEWVAVEPVKAATTTAGGIYLPGAISDSKLDLVEGKVVAVGKGRLLDNGQTVKPTTKIGETVLFVRGAALFFERSGVEFVFVAWRDVITTIT